jgi:hypothetical protein
MKIVNSREEFLNELNYLLPQKPICIEIGVETGDFSKMILKLLNPEKLYLVDPWQKGFDKNDVETYGEILNNLPTAYSTEYQYQNILKELYNEIKSNQVIVRPDFSYNVVNDFKENYFDFIYIDSCHLYNSVKFDLNSFLPKLKKGAIMAGHDYFDFDNFGVIQAVDEFINEFDFEMIILNSSGFDWALKQKTK